MGTYTVLASFAGSTDYTSGTASTTFTISKATPSVNVTDSGGTYNGSAYTATDSVAGVGSQSTASPSLESVTPSLTYYSGASVTGSGSSAAPTTVGTYTVLASFAGSTDYTTGTASTTFTISKAPPSVNVTDSGGTYNGSAYTATDSVAGVGSQSTASPSLESVTPSLTYYSGASVTGSGSSAAPSTAGTYTVLASFAGSTDYTTGTASTTFTISNSGGQTAPTLTVTDNSGIFTGAAFTATDTIAGVGSQSTPAASLEGVTPTLTYYSGTSATGTALSGAPRLAGTYTVLASFAGSADYTSVTASTTFAINPDYFLVDDPQATYTGTWATYPEGFEGSEHFTSPASGGAGATPTATATYTFTNLPAGQYQVLATWSAASNHATNTPYTYYDGTQLVGSTAVDQTVASIGVLEDLPNGFQPLATVTVSSGTLNVVISNNANGIVVADAIAIVPVGVIPTISGTTSTTTILGNETATPFSGVTLTSVNPSQSIFNVTVTLSTPASGTLSNLGGGTLTGGVYSLTQATLAAAQTALQGLVFTPGPLLGASSATTTFTIRFGNGLLGSTDSTTTVTTVAALVIDDPQAVYTGTWANYDVGFNGNQHFTSPASGGASATPTATATYTFTNLPAGQYQVLATWPTASNHATNTPYTYYDDTQLLSSTTVNQRFAPIGIGPNGFQPLATVTVSSGTLNVVISNNANGIVVADAVEIVSVAPTPTPTPTPTATPFQNPVNPLDVLGTGGPITPADALAVIDYLTAHPAGTVLPSIFTPGSDYYDVLGLGTVVPADALAIIDYLSNQPAMVPAVSPVLSPTVSPAVTNSATGTDSVSGAATAAGSVTSSPATTQSQVSGDISLPLQAQSSSPVVSPAVVASGQVSGPINSSSPSSSVASAPVAAASTSPSQSSVKPLAVSASQTVNGRPAPAPRSLPFPS